MKNIGVYLAMEPYMGGSFQYARSILAALDALDKNAYQVTAFFVQDLWELYLAQFTFRRQKIYLDPRWKMLPARILRRICRLCHIDFFHIRNIYAAISSVSRQIDKHKMDILVMAGQDGMAVELATPCISIMHDLMHRYETFPEASSPDQIESREFLYRNMCAASQMIFVDSDLGRQQAIESYGEQYTDKFVVMPFTPPMYLFESNDIDEDIRLPEKFFFYPAQFWKHKNHKNLLLAMDELRDCGVRVQMIFVGSAKNGYDEVLQIIQEHHLEEQIEILGYVSDDVMRTLYQKARAMIMPSFFGPTNIPPLEGMAMGCPVAVSRVYAMPWQVGDAGLTFDPHDVHEIADVLRRLWEDDGLCRLLIEKGKERAKYFSQERFNQRFREAIKRLTSCH